MTALKVSVFLAALAGVFAIAMGVGSAVDPIDQPDPAAHAGDDHDDGSHEADTERAEHLPGGLMVSQDGYTLETAARSRAGRDVPVAFTITGPDGHPVTSYDVQHEKQLHLIAVRRDFNGFQHVHPALDSEGVWHTSLDLAPGQWRLLADFKPSGAKALTLGADVAVAGEPRLAKPAVERSTSEVGGYTVTLDGKLTPGTDSRLSIHVGKDGRPVSDLQPYLGAFGHLVALREGDLAYLHVHPDESVTNPGPEVVFFAAVPSQGTYRLFLDFKHEDVVRTASFVASASGGHDDDH